MNFSAKNWEYGPVIVTRGPHKGKVGNFDDNTAERGREYAIVYFAGFGLTDEYSLVPITYLRLPNTQDLLSRYNTLWRQVTVYLQSPLSGQMRLEALLELAYVGNLLNDRMFDAQFYQKHTGSRIFLSHASVDKAFVRSLAVDLASLGHRPWLDEWEILGGESIPSRIADGLEESDFVVLVLSKDSVASQWVENEWQTKFWDEIGSKRVLLIPVLLSDCKIPTLLKTKKYIDFRDDYSAALESLARTLSMHTKRKLRK